MESGFLVEGVATGGLHSAVALPEYNLCFDMGRAHTAARTCRDVLITHGHQDHVGDVVRHALGRTMTGAEPSRIICQPRLAPLIEENFQLMYRFQRGRRASYEIIPIEPGMEVALSGRLVARPFATDHTLDSQGYVVVDVRHRLKAEFDHLKGTREGGQEIARLKRAGVEVTEPFEIPLVAYTGDTRRTVFDVYSAVMNSVRSAKLLFVECTYLCSEKPPKEAHHRGHIHIRDIAQLGGVLNNEAVCLVHFSPRYSNRDVREAIKTLPRGLRNRTHYLPLKSDGGAKAFRLLGGST